MADMPTICDILQTDLPAIKIIEDAAPAFYMGAPIIYKPGHFEKKNRGKITESGSVRPSSCPMVTKHPEVIDALPASGSVRPSSCLMVTKTA